MHFVCMVSEQERLKSRLSDLRFAGNSMWKTSDDKDLIEKEMNTIAKKLRSKYKLEDWEY